MVENFLVASAAMYASCRSCTASFHTAQGALERMNVANIISIQVVCFSFSFFFSLQRVKP